MGSQLQIHRAERAELLHTQFEKAGFWTLRLRVFTEEGEVVVTCFSIDKLKVTILDEERG